MSADYLWVTANEILTAATSALTQTRTGNPAPTRTNVSWTAPPADECCEGGGQLTVNLDGQGLGNGGPIVIDRTPRKQSSLAIPEATYRITLYRCVPTVGGDGAPDALDLDNSAKGLLSDLWALVKGILDGLAAGTLYTGATCDNGWISRIETSIPKGGCAGIAVYVSQLANDVGP